MWELYYWSIEQEVNINKLRDLYIFCSKIFYISYGHLTILF